MADIASNYTIYDLVDALFKKVDFDQANSILNQEPELVNQRFDMWALGEKYIRSVARETPLTALLIEASHIKEDHEILAKAEDVLKFLIEHGADVNKTEGTVVRPLTLAIETHVPTIVKALIDAGADTDYEVVGGYIRINPNFEFTPKHIVDLIPDEDLRAEMNAALTGDLIIAE